MPCPAVAHYPGPHQRHWLWIRNIQPAAHAHCWGPALRAARHPGRWSRHLPGARVASWHIRSRGHCGRQGAGHGGCPRHRSIPHSRHRHLPRLRLVVWWHTGTGVRLRLCPSRPSGCAGQGASCCDGHAALQRQRRHRHLHQLHHSEQWPVGDCKRVAASGEP